MGIENITIAKLEDGTLKEYDLASRTKKLKSTYSYKFDYIGCGTVYSVDGDVQDEEMQIKYYFFVMNSKHPLYAENNIPEE